MFKLTANTDPKTIMFEGFPQVPIEKITPVPGDCGRFYVYIGKVPEEKIIFGGYPIRETNNHSYDGNGRPRATWPAVVPRFVIDHTKPIGVRLIRADRFGSNQDELDSRGYHITARIVPLGTDEPELLRISRTPEKHGYDIDIDPTTGRVPEGTQAGSNLQFFNRPDVKILKRSLEVYGYQYPLEVTITDDVVTNIEWKPA